jgi:hypothetical protein
VSFAKQGQAEVVLVGCGAPNRGTFDGVMDDKIVQVEDSAAVGICFLTDLLLHLCFFWELCRNGMVPRHSNARRQVSFKSVRFSLGGTIGSRAANAYQRQRPC